MPSVDLTDEEWQKIMAILSGAPWNVANPLLMKIGGQLSRKALVGRDGAAQQMQETPTTSDEVGVKH
jgi:hypothetical protein